MRVLAPILLILSACGDDARFALAGIDRPRDVRRFLNDLKDAADAGDLESLADHIRLPFTTYSKGEAVRQYATRSELKPDLERLFTRRVLAAIQDQNFATLFVNYQGVMIGRGAVWFDGFDGQIRIKAVNP